MLCSGTGWQWGNVTGQQPGPLAINSPRGPKCIQQRVSASCVASPGTWWLWPLFLTKPGEQALFSLLPLRIHISTSEGQSCLDQAAGVRGTVTPHLAGLRWGALTEPRKSKWRQNYGSLPSAAATTLLDKLLPTFLHSS